MLSVPSGSHRLRKLIEQAAVSTEAVSSGKREPSGSRRVRKPSAKAAASAEAEAAGIYEELDRLLENPTLNSLLQTLSATTMIDEYVLHDFIAGLATSGFAGGGVAADPKSAALFQRERLELLKGGSPTRDQGSPHIAVDATAWG
ncbi:hypothetical protein T492DRAFT_853044 [Pavlovales sp. CCMP2436]|nr:hypothetical protein T492DRAFT_853044 [Pavlovales sp. CCMP2436]